MLTLPAAVLPPSAAMPLPEAAALALPTAAALVLPTAAALALQLAAALAFPTTAALPNQFLHLTFFHSHFTINLMKLINFFLLKKLTFFPC